MQNFNRTITFTTIIVVLFLTVTAVYADSTQVAAGNVFGHWTTAGNPYIINGHITVQDTSVLTIDPGVQVHFRGIYRFTVLGHLNATGTQQDSIFFGPVGGVQGWGGFRFHDADSTKLAYCIFRRGRAQGGDQVPDSVKSGANMFIYRGSVTVDNSRFYDGIATYSGGSVAIWNSSPTIRNCLIETSTTSNYAGAVMVWNNSNPTFENVIIRLNQSVFAGGMYIANHSRVSFTGCEFRNNVATGGENTGLGGAVLLGGGSSAGFTKTIFADNSGHAGGAVNIRDEGTQAQFTWCDFYSNIANAEFRVGGAVYIRSNASVHFDYCRFFGNGGDWGGGIYVKEPPDVIVNHCLFTKNGATRGGGAIGTSTDLQNGYIYVNNCTFVDNRYTGGGEPTAHDVYVREGARMKITSSIAAGPAPHFADAERVEVTYSLVQGGYQGEGNTDEDPNFFSALDTTWYILAGNSNCVDSGFPDSTDLDGSRTDRGWLHFPHNIWDSLGVDSSFVELTVEEREKITVHLTNTSNVPIFVTPMDRWSLGEPQVAVNISQITEDNDINGVVWTSQGYFVSGAGDGTPQIYKLDEQFGLEESFDQPGEPSGEGFLDLTSDGESVMYGGDMGRIIEFTSNGELGFEYEGPADMGSYRALGADFANPNGFVEYYLGDEEGTLVRADIDMTEERRYNLGAPIVALGVKENIRNLYVITEPQPMDYQISLFDPDEGILNPLFRFDSPEGYYPGGFEITQSLEPGKGKMVGIFKSIEVDDPGEDKLFVTDLYTSWLVVWPEVKFLMPGEEASWEITVAGDQMEAGLYTGAYQMAVNGYGDGGEDIVVMDLHIVGVKDTEHVLMPDVPSIAPIYPNPFNGTINIGFNLPVAMNYSLNIYDITGRSLGLVKSGYGHAGQNRLHFNPAGYPSGKYFIGLWTDNGTDFKEIILVK